VPELAPGDVFAGHRIEGVAGRGGMGVVYRAIQLDLDRRVALKLIAPSLAEDAAFRDRFVRESRAAASIDHPNVIPIFYTGEEGGQLYIAMRYVEGSDLRTLVRAGGPLSAERAARLADQVGSALDAAHARGIVHRDVKPANVLLGAGDHAYLTDFGLTKRLASHSGSTQAGGWVGTLGYVAPEQIRSERVDARTDVYALGCVLYYALTARPPYQRDSDEATLWAHLHDPPPHVHQDAPDVPEGFEDVLGRALAKDPDERFASAGDLGRAALAAAGLRAAPLRGVVATGAAAPLDEAETRATPLEAPPTTAAGPRRRWRTAPAWRWAAALAAIGALVAGAVVALGVGSGGGDPATTGTATTVPDGPPASAAGRLGPKVRIGGRPNSVVVASGDVWATRSGNDRLAILDDAGGRRLPDAPAVGSQPADAVAGFGELWVIDQSRAAIVPIDLGSRRQSLAAIPLPTRGKAVAIDHDSRALWVGIRVRGAPALLLKIDPRAGRTLRQIPLPEGLQDLAVGGGAVWVVGRRTPTLTRFEVQTGQSRAVPVGAEPAGVAYGEGAAWVTSAGEDSVTRVTPTLQVSSVPVGGSPQGIAVGGGAVWVANRDDATLTRIDPRTRRRVGQPIAVDAAPYALDVDGDHLWVGSLNTGTLQRIDFR
jgi:streptogramin lyase